MKGKKNNEEGEKKRKDFPELEPATTANGREQQLSMLALDAIEDRIRNHEASGMELVYLAKLGSQNTRMEQEKHDAEIQLMQAKIKALEAAESRDRLYSDAIEAFKSYVVEDE